MDSGTFFGWVGSSAGSFEVLMGEGISLVGLLGGGIMGSTTGMMLGVMDDSFDAVE